MTRIYLSEKTLNRLNMLNPSALDAEGNLKSLVEQYGEYMMRREIDPDLTTDSPYVIEVDGSRTGVGKLKSKPIVISNSSLKHIFKKHGANIAMLNNLGEELAENLFAFEHVENEDKMTFVLNSKSDGGHDIIAVLRADLNMNHVDVASVRSCHGKEVNRLLESIGEAMDAGREVYVNGRTGAWLEILEHISDKSDVAEEVQRRLFEIYYKRYGRPMEEGSPAATPRAEGWDELLDWQYAKYLELCSVASEPPACFGGQYRLPGANYVSEERFNEVLPTEAERQLYLLLSRADLEGEAGARLRDTVLLCRDDPEVIRAIADAHTDEDEAETFYTEMYAGEFDAQELLEIYEERPWIFTKEDIEEGFGSIDALNEMRSARICRNRASANATPSTDGIKAALDSRGAEGRPRLNEMGVGRPKPK